MCLLALFHRTQAAAPLLLASNREEYFDRASLPPEVGAGPPRVLAGRDTRAGGTWLGINEHGLVVAVTNRLKSRLPDEPRSRGLLCRELLNCTSAREAIAAAERELATDRYAGANYLCADRRDAAVVAGGDQLVVWPLAPGLHLIANGDPNDPADPRIAFARSLLGANYPHDVESFLSRSATAFRQGPDARGRTIILRGPDRGTVSSTQIALTRNPTEAVYRFASQAPDRVGYDDYSALLRAVLLPRM